MMGERLRALRDRVKTRHMFCRECGNPIVEVHDYGTDSEECADLYWARFLI